MLRQALTSAVILLATGCVIEEPYPLESSLADFKSATAQTANYGYRELRAGGARSIPLLLANADVKAAYAGSAFQDPSSSLTLLPDRPTQGIVALYLIESIRMQREHPHVLPLVIGKDGTAPGDAQERGASAYREWWSKLGAPGIDQVRAAPDPLDGTGLRWR